MDRQRIAFVSHSYLEPATRTKLVCMARHQDVRLITPSSYPTPYGWRDLDIEGSAGLQIQSYPIQFLHFKRTPTRWFLRSRDLGFREFQPDIIHVEMEPHGWITCQVLLYRRLFAPHAKLVVFTWENLSLLEQGTKARALEYLSILNRQWVDLFLCGNGAGRDILLAKGIPDNKIMVLPQVGVDPESFYPYSPERRTACRRQLGISDEEFAVGFVGRFVPEKGILDLLEAVIKLKVKSKRTPVLVLAGGGKLEETVRSRCAEPGLKLVIGPPRKYEEVVEVMNALDVLVLPSQSRPFWKEQFGRVLIEAMACGVPVIGSDSGEIPNVIGNAGLIFQEGNREQLFRCLESCCEDQKYRSYLREMGLKRVLEHFTNLTIAERTLHFYDRLKGPAKGEEHARRDASPASMSQV